MPLALLRHWAAATLWPVQIEHVGPLAWYGQTLVISVPLAASWHTAARDRRPLRDRPPRSVRATPCPTVS